MYQLPLAVTQPLVTGSRDGGRAERSHARACAFSAAAAAAMRALIARAQVDSSQCCICGQNADHPLACGCPFRHVFCDAVCFSARAFALMICAELDPRDDGAVASADREPAPPSPLSFPLPPPLPPPTPVDQQKHILPQPPASAPLPPPPPPLPPQPPTSSRSTVPDAAAASVSVAVAAASSAAPTPRRQPRAPANKRAQADFIRRLEEAELALYQTLANTRK